MKAVCFLVFLFLVGFVFDRSDAMPQETQIPSNSMLTEKVDLTILDPHGNGISHVAIIPIALQSLEDPGVTSPWHESLVPSAPITQTGPDGKATIHYPLRYGRRQESKTSRVFVRVCHPDYVSREIPIDASMRSLRESLIPGNKLTLATRELDREATSDWGVLMSGNAENALWLRLDTNAKMTRSIPSGQWQAMLVRLSKEGPTDFSGLLPVRIKDGQKASIRNIEWSPGIRLRGKLAESVPRPVEQGWIIAQCVPSADSESVHRNSTIVWEDAAAIAEDGTFVFAPLPHQGRIQLIAGCRGWIIDGRETPLVKGMIYPTADWSAGHELILPMEETGDLAIRLRMPNGEPIRGAAITLWLGQSLEGTGISLLGSYLPSLDRVKAQIENRWETTRRVQLLNLVQSTDRNGIAILRDLPLHLRGSLSVEHPDMDLKFEHAPEQPIVDKNYPFRLIKTGLSEWTIEMTAQQSN